MSISNEQFSLIINSTQVHIPNDIEGIREGDYYIQKNYFRSKILW